jgi:DNA-binding MarR family transcriptional regulator
MSKRRRESTETRSPESANVAPPDWLRQLAWFRYQLRRFLRFSEQACRAQGVTPQQYQLMLGVAAYTARGWATVSELAEFLQERHNAVVGLVGRAARQGLVRKEPGARDRRFVRVHLTGRGTELLTRLAQMHGEEANNMLAAARSQPEAVAESAGA